MNNIKSLGIHNFKIINDAHFDFHENVNIISGASCNGKTASLSALLLPITNKPSSYKYKPHNMKKKDYSYSNIVFDDGSVRRERSNSINKYVVNEEKPALEAFGVNVPSKVSDLVNIPYYNIHNQHDGYFLDDSAGQVANKINEVCNLSIIHETSAIIESIVSKNKSNLKMKELLLLSLFLT